MLLDYERELFYDYISFLKKMDEKLKAKEKYNKENNIKEKANLSEKDERLKQKWMIRIKDK